MIWFLVPPSRSIRSVPVTRSISLVSACGRMLCAVFVSSFSCDVPWRRVVSFSFSSRSSSRLARLVGRLVAILCGSSAVPSRSSIRPASRQAVRSRFARASRSSARRASRPAVRFPVLFIVPCLVPRLAWASRQAVRILSFCLAARLGGSWCRVVFSVSFFSVLVVYRSLRLMAMAAARLSHLVAAGSRPRCLPSWNPIGLMAVAE